MLVHDRDIKKKDVKEALKGFYNLADNREKNEMINILIDVLSKSQIEKVLPQIEDINQGVFDTALMENDSSWED